MAELLATATAPAEILREKVGVDTVGYDMD